MIISKKDCDFATNQTMKKYPPTMQKNGRKGFCSLFPPFDTGTARAYPCWDVSLPHHRMSVLLLPDAGVWVGT
jgi:hypothetical protein